MCFRIPFLCIVLLLVPAAGADEKPAALKVAAVQCSSDLGDIAASTRAPPLGLISPR